jgi:DNA repair protein RadA/Sms
LGVPAGDGRSPLGCFGEVGLTGELRYVGHADRRLEEASRFGVGRVIVPSACVDRDITASSMAARAVASTTVAEALTLALDAAAHTESGAG